MKVGLFDHVEAADRPLSTLFDERLTFAQAADEAGIYCLHVAEHHATPLNMVPVPGVYLGALARATKPSTSASPDRKENSECTCRCARPLILHKCTVIPLFRSIP